MAHSIQAHSVFSGRKAVVAALVALTLGAGAIASAGEAEARYGRKGLIAAGVVGALATGALIAGSRPSYGYTNPGPVYHEPAPVYYHQPAQVYYHRPAAPVYYEEPAYEYVPTCRIRKERVWLSDGGYTFRRTRVCR